MSEERLDRIEKALEKVVNTVGTIMEEQSSMRENQASMWSEMKVMREESEKNHREIMNKFRVFERNQDHLWDKVLQNEQEFIKFKNQF